MKQFNLLTALLLMSGVAFAQSEEKKEIKVPFVQQEFFDIAGKGIDISSKATAQEGSKGKRISISSAARKSSLMKSRAVKSAEMAEKGEGKSKDAPSIRPAQPGRPAQQGRPATVVPPAKPTPPVVRPNAPAHHTPKRPAGPPSGIPRGGM